MSRTKTLEWYSGFKSCQSLVEGFERADRPPSGRINKNVEKVREIIHEDGRLAINNVSNILHVAYGTCARVWTEDWNIKRAAEFVPLLLNDDQKHKTNLKVILIGFLMLRIYTIAIWIGVWLICIMCTTVWRPALCRPFSRCVQCEFVLPPLDAQIPTASWRLS
jgi:hypothetical protein